MGYLYLKNKIIKKIEESFEGKGPIIDLKDDKSIVTDIDKYISEEVEKLYSDKFFVLSEENDNRDFRFPLCILDPIDGTIEFSQGIGECVFSMALFKNENISSIENNAVLFNPFTGLEITSEDKFVSPKKYFDGKLNGLVSRTETEKGYYNTYDRDEISLITRGSVAFKLALLSIGAADFVISLRPKKIWDIAAGMILLAQRGFKIYSKEEEIKRIDRIEYESPLCFCRSIEDRDRVYRALNISF